MGSKGAPSYRECYRRRPRDRSSCGHAPVTRSVLVVARHPHICTLFQDTIRWLVGTEVEVKDDIADAFVWVRTTGPALVVLDIDLRGALGLIQHLKAVLA